MQRPTFPRCGSIRGRLPGLLLGFAIALLAASAADAQCRNPGQSCGILGGSCCSGSSCVLAICVANPSCQGENGLCTSSSQCCGSRVCEVGFCQTPVDLGDACGPASPCKSGLVCDPLAGFVCVDQDTDIGNACGPLVQCADGGVCDPLAGFVCVAETTPTVGQACGPLFPCAEGLFCDPLAGFVCVDQTAGEGAPCGPLAQCNEGLFCDPLAGFRCVPAAGVDEPCGPGVPCGDGLQCSLALRCSSIPAQAGETCDVTAPCGDGLFCQPGIPQRCREYRKPGEGCSAVNPCIAGASCEVCFTEGCNAPLQCFWNANEGAISEQTCRALRSPGIARSVEGSSLTKTVASGNGIGIVASESQAFGVAYGQDGRYGCFTALCGGIFTDVSIEGLFLSVGFYNDFDAVGGMSFVNLQSAQTPFNLLSYTASQAFERFGNDFPPITGELIGTEAAFGLGAGLNPSPFTAGSFYCETVLDTVIDPAMGDAAVSLAVPSSTVVNNGFTENLFGWTCVGDGACTLSDDDALESAVSGSGEVTSPPNGIDPAIAYLASSCTSVTPGEGYTISAWTKTLGAIPGELVAYWNAGLDCDGPLVRMDPLGESPADETWREVRVARQAPLGAQSVQLLMSAERDPATGALSTSRVDVVLIPAPSAMALAVTALGTVLGAIALRRRHDRR